MRGILIHLLAITFGVLLFASGTEMACRIIFSQSISYDIEMWNYARQLKATGLTPGLRFEHKPNSSAHLMGVDVLINADGLREREFSRKRSSNRVRIAVIGDSITFGWGVAQDRTYARQLEDQLNQQRPLGSAVSFETINFGVGNYNIIDVADMLQYKALAYQPDLVIYGAFVNDAEAIGEGDSGSWLLRHSVAAVWVWGRLDRLLRGLGRRDDYLAYYRGLYDEGSAGQRQVRENLSLMSQRCKEKGVSLIVAMLPELHDHEGDPFGSIRGFYRDAALGSGAIFIDLNESLTDNGRRRFWVSADDAHPNAEAFSHFARTIADGIPWQQVDNRKIITLPLDRPE